MNVFNVIIAVITIAGAILINYKRPEGFLLWIVSNAAWIYIDFVKGIPEQSIVYVFFFFTSIQGWFLWRTGTKQPIKEAV